MTVTSEANTSSTFPMTCYLSLLTQHQGSQLLEASFLEIDIAVNSRNAQENVSRERDDRVTGSKKNNSEETKIEKTACNRKYDQIKERRKIKLVSTCKRIFKKISFEKTTVLINSKTLVGKARF